MPKHQPKAKFTLLKVLVSLPCAQEKLARTSNALFKKLKVTNRQTDRQTDRQTNERWNIRDEIEKEMRCGR